ncbi:hypothetical protein HIM_02484 [Hirsutella minnesotensis 3608]|nr:hypothetical protein HIM_02484 [Hirsutella minnesotensis 3608]
MVQRTSLDGKGRKKPDAPSKRHKASKSRPVKQQHSPSLKDASPPKTNPWSQPKSSSPRLKETSKCLDQETWPLADGAATDAAKHTLPTPADTPARSPTVEDQAFQDNAPLLDPSSHRNSSLISQASSRAALQAAAARSGESLWIYPFGADIFVFTESMVIQVHRNMVAAKSGWIREKLLPASSSGAPVGVYFPGAAKIIGHSLKFIYTDRVDPCEATYYKPRELTSVVCCSLFYVAAIDLQIPTMALYVLKTLGLTAQHWKTLIATRFRSEPLSHQEGTSFMLCLKNAFEAAYGHPYQDALKPFRLALVGFFDAVVPLIIEYPTTSTLFNTNVWQRHASLISADLVEGRQQNESTPSAATLQALFEKVPRDCRDFLTSRSVADKSRSSTRHLQDNRSVRSQ